MIFPKSRRKKLDDVEARDFYGDLVLGSEKQDHDLAIRYSRFPNLL